MKTVQDFRSERDTEIFLLFTRDKKSQKQISVETGLSISRIKAIISNKRAELYSKDTDARRYYVMRYEEDKCKTQPNNS